ncbi:MAG: YihY/virulence factor BrkB family protein [Solirubrobacterales bacterium]
MEGPQHPAQLRRHAWWGVLKRTVSEFRADNLTDWAAALTYYAILSIFPALIVLVSILGLAGDSATNAVLDNINELGPGPAQDIISGAIREIASSQGTAGLAFVIGLVAALWSASGYVGAFSRASNVIYETEEGRPFWKLRPLQVGMTLVLLLLVAVSAIAIVVSGPLASDVGKIFGVEGTAVTIFNIVKWPVIVLIVMTMLAILYYGAPNVRHPGFRWITPGGILAVVLWILASAGFAAYVANFGSYNATYGSLAGVIVFLIWLWISNVAVLLGAEMNAEIERGRELESGVPEEETIAMEPRAPAKGRPRQA